MKKKTTQATKTMTSATPSDICKCGKDKSTHLGVNLFCPTTAFRPADDPRGETNVRELCRMCGDYSDDTDVCCGCKRCHTGSPQNKVLEYAGRPQAPDEDKTTPTSSDAPKGKPSREELERGHFHSSERCETLKVSLERCKELRAELASPKPARIIEPPESLLLDDVDSNNTKAIITIVQKLSDIIRYLNHE